MGKERFQKVLNTDRKQQFSIAESSKELHLAKSYCTVWPFTVNEMCDRDCFHPDLPGIEVSWVHMVPNMGCFVIQARDCELHPQRWKEK